MSVMIEDDDYIDIPWDGPEEVLDELFFNYHKLLNDSNSSDCTDTLSDVLSEEEDEIEETDEEEFEEDMESVESEFKKMMLVHEGLSREVSKCLEEYRDAQSSDPNSDDELLQKHIKRKRRRKQLISQGLNPDDYETSSTETSLSTESEEPFTSSEADTDEAIEKKVLEEKFAASSGKKEARKLDAKHKKKLGLSPAPSDIPNELLNNSPKKKVASPEKSTGELFKNIVEKSKLNKSTPTKDNGKCKDKAARPVAAANSNGNTTPKKESAKSETHEHHTCMSDHEDGEHGHDHFSEHHPCHCVHCELLGNTPNQRGNFRDEQARARLRKKLEKRKQASGQCVEPKCEKICSNPNNASSRQQGDESSSPTLSSRSTVSSQKDSRTGTPQAKTAKRMPFSFSTAMDLRPVRSSTSSKNIETCDGDYDGKREWIDCAYEDILNMCQEKKLKNTPTNASLNSVQSWLRTAIKDRLDAQKDAKDKMPVHQIIAEEVIAAEEAEKKAEEAKRLKKKKKKQAAKQRKEELKKQEEAKLEAERRAKQKIEEEEAERRAQEKREEEEMENVFTPVDNIEGLDPDDRDVESFKKFCLEFVPKFPRLKIPLQSLNLPPLVVPQ